MKRVNQQLILLIINEKMNYLLKNHFEDLSIDPNSRFDNLINGNRFVMKPVRIIERAK